MYQSVVSLATLYLLYPYIDIGNFECINFRSLQCGVSQEYSSFQLLHLQSVFLSANFDLSYSLLNNFVDHSVDHVVGDLRRTQYNGLTVKF